MVLRPSNPEREKYVHLLYHLLSLHDEIVIQNDLYNTSNVDTLLNRMESLILDALEERQDE